MEHPTEENLSSSMHWSQERLHADVHRAVGGALNLVRELSRISHELDPEMPVEWMIKRTQFFAYELQSDVGVHLSADATERDRLAFLNRFFFESKRFQCITEMANLNRPSDAFRLSRVLAARSGSPLVLALLYSFLAEKIGVRVELVDFNPAWFLKWTDQSQPQSRARYIDVANAGATLSCDEMFNALQSRHQMTVALSDDSRLEPLTFERFLVVYLGDLKSAYSAKENDAQKLLFLQNALIAYQPSNINLLAERALIHRRLGHLKSALTDLKRFFTFNDRERCSPELVKLHDDLVKILDRSH